MTKSENLLDTSDIDNNKEEEINLQFFINTILRNKKFIGLITVILMVLSVIYGYTRKKIWSGSFQIVIASEENPRIPNFGIANNLITSEFFGNKDIKTQVEIISSPSVLMPIFKYVEEEKNKVNKKTTPYFKKWKNDYLKIGLTKNTSVVNVTYTDADKKLIMNVLDKIVYQYKNFSISETKEGNNLNAEFLKSQINSYTNKSAESISEVQKYSIENNLYFSDTDLRPENFASVNIEKKRFKANNLIKESRNQLDLLKSSNYDSDLMIYLSSKLNKSNINQILNELILLNNKLNENKLKFTENDKTFKELKLRKEISIENLKNKLFKTLTNSISENQLFLKDTEKPLEIILNYKKLLRNAYRDQNTLNSLEKELTLVSLNQSKIYRSWETITKPTINEIPVGRSKKSLLALATFFGLFVSSAIAILIEKLKGVIYEIEELNNLIGEKPTINLKIIKGELNNIKRILKSKFSEKDNKLNVVSYCDTNLTQYKNLKKEIFNIFEEDKLVFTNKISAQIKSKNLLIIQPGFIKYKDLNQIKYILKLNEKIIDAWILIEREI